MEHFRWQLTTSASGLTFAPSQYVALMKALDSIWVISVKVVLVAVMRPRY